jgi:predicted amidophosphoribosyltransferase
MEIHPIKLDGNWNEGWALDFHTISSKRVSEPVYIEVYNNKGEIELVEADGLASIQTIRPPVAESLFQLKYHFDKTKVDEIANSASIFLSNKIRAWRIDYVIPIPPSDLTRSFQPVYELVNSISKKTNLSVNFDVLKKTKSTSQLKSITNLEERRNILNGAFDCGFNALIGKNVLLFDDLYRSGETLNSAISILKSKGKCSNIYVLTITKTRIKS